MVAINKPPVDQSMMIWFMFFGLGLGFMLVWTYAAIRPRFGPGVKTAICASTLVWGLAELIIAGIAGAWVYTETQVVL